MHTTDTFLDRLRELNVQLQLNGDRLGCSAPKGVLTPALTDEIRQRKPELIARLKELAADEANAEIATLPRGERLPLSAGQRRLWFLQRYDRDSYAYNIVLAVRFRGYLDTHHFADALRAVVERHEALRTGFDEIDGAPYARVDAAREWRAEIVELNGRDDAAVDAVVRELATEMAQRPFDLTHPPLIRALIARASPDHHVLAIVVHHIVADGWSLGVLFQDAARLYRRRIDAEAPALEDLRIQFVDYAGWIDRSQSRAAQAQLTYWKDQLRAPLPVIELPSDRARPAMTTFRGNRRNHVFAAGVMDAVKDLARREGATPFIVLLSAFKALVYRYTRQTDIVIGSATAGRNRPEVERLVGLFINTLVLRTSLTGSPTGRALIARVRDTVLNASAHADVPFDELVTALHVQRDLSHPPVVQVMFTLQNFPLPELDLAGVTAEQVVIDPGVARLDLTVEAIDYQGQLVAAFEYNTDLFDESTIRRMQSHFERLLGEMLKAPDTPIDLLPMLTAAEEAEVDAMRGATGGPDQDWPRLDQLIEASLRRTPEQVAVRCGAESRTCAEVSERSTALAAALRQRGVRHGDVVAVCLDRSVDMPVALLGVLKSGAAYVPLDPIYPADRLAFMLEDSGARVVVADRQLADRLPSCAVPILWLEPETWATEDATVAETGSGDDLAYILYTSGSTGRPKGVEIEHHSVVNFLESMRVRPGLSTADRLVAVTTLCFDIAGLEMYLPLLTGAELIVAPRSVAIDPRQLQELLTTSGATVMQATPATWRMLLEAGWTGTPGLRIFCGGEALPRDLANRLLTRADAVWNLYGPTETTIWSTVERITASEGPITVGGPIANTALYVLDANRQPLPTGVAGELYIGGAGLARGYHNRPDLTDRAFVADPFSPGRRLYRTGDLARWCADGRLELLGRIDLQVKIRGYRVELGEIEAALQHVDGVAHSVVVMQGSGGDERLIAFLTAADGARLDPTQVRDAVGRSLPDYMVPSQVIELPALPLTPNGKVDRKALPSAAAWQSAQAASAAPPASRIERAVADIWQSLLKVERVARHDNFFDIGGHSLLVVQMQNRLRARFGRDVPLVDLFQRPTVTGIASLLQVSDAALSS